MTRLGLGLCAAGFASLSGCLTEPSAATGGAGGSAAAGEPSGSSGSSAGGSNSAGSGGSSGSGMPPTVSPCTALPAAGTWENITPPGVGETDAIVVDPFDTAIIWLGAKDHGIFKSTDCGATWTHVNTGINGASMDSGAPGSMVVDPVNQGVMYSTAFFGSNGLWKSSNGGVDWEQLFPVGSEVQKVVEYNLINSIAMDRQNPQHLVASMHANCAPPYGPVCEAESLDGGATWKITTVPVDSGGWVAGAGAFILGESTWLFGTYSLGLWLTKDHGATFANVTPAGASGSTSGKTLILPFTPSDTGKYYLAAMEGVLQSSDGESWSLLPGSGGRTVGFAMGGDHLYSADQWSSTYHSSRESEIDTWTVIPPPAGLPADQGAPYLAYDDTHHALYSSNWAGGAWRLVTP